MAAKPSHASVDHLDLPGQAAFVRFAKRVFPGIDFGLWQARGGWTEDYQAHAVFEGEQIVASVSSMRMRLLIAGRAVHGVQLGAVGCVPEHRGRGLMRPLLEQALARAAQAELVFLYANEDVLDFYPRFGFARATESVFEASLRLAPSPVPAPRVDLEDADQRAAWLSAYGRALPLSERFGAAGYGPIALWHACNFYPRAVRALPACDAWAVAVQQGEVLQLLDLAASRPLDLLEILPQLIDAPIARVRFGFSPERWLSDFTALPDPESALFVRGSARLPEAPLRLPALAQT